MKNGIERGKINTNQAHIYSSATPDRHKIQAMIQKKRYSITSRCLRDLGPEPYRKSLSFLSQLKNNCNLQAIISKHRHSWVVSAQNLSPALSLFECKKIKMIPIDKFQSEQETLILPTLIFTSSSFSKVAFKISNFGANDQTGRVST